MKTQIMTFIKKYPVLTYFALAFAISWGGIFIAVGGPGGDPGAAEQFDPLSPSFLLVMAAWFSGPSLASILLTGLVDGGAGFRRLLTRMMRWQGGARWFAVALLTAPLLMTAVLFVLSLLSPEFLPSIITTSDKAALVLMGIGYGLVGGGFLEELGWTGFAVPKLRLRYGVLATGLIVGFLWGAYHFSVVFWVDGAPSGAVSLAVLCAQLFAFMPAFRVLMVWVYDRTESLLVAMLMHASLSAATLILQPVTTGVTQLIYLLVFGAAVWVAVAAVAVANGGRLSRQPLRDEKRHIMINIFKKQNGMTIIGQGGKIILFTLPPLIAAIWVHAYLPQIAALPEGISFSRPVGYLFLIPGLILWGAAVIQLMTGFSKGKLVTTGAYGVVRNPIYSSVTFFVLPAVALLTLTWVYFVPSVFLYVGVMIFIGKEEGQLTEAFGEQYEDYLARVDRLVPFKKTLMARLRRRHAGWKAYQAHLASQK